jgi:hypothetical protein
MDTGSIVGITGTIVTVVIAVYAIRDVRKQVYKMILIERNIAFSRIVQDFAWLFLEPTGTGHTLEIAKGLEEFSMLAEVLDGAKTHEVSKSTVENEALATAKDLVEAGYAKWKGDWEMEAVEKALGNWRNEKNSARVARMFGQKSAPILPIE